MKKKNESIISVSIFLLLANFVLVHSLYSEELVKQKISIITLTKDFNSLFTEAILYSKLMETNEIIIQDTFGDQPTDFLFFMYQNKLSGLIVITNTNIMIFTTKGLITNIKHVSTENIEEISSYILSVYKPTLPKKIYQEIEKIDYISPLEETNLRFNLYVGTTLYKTFDTEIYTNTNQIIRRSESESRGGVGISLGFGIDTRYISFDTSIRLGLDNTYYGISTMGGVWLLKGFLMIGLGINLSRYEYSLKDYNNIIFSDENRIAINYLTTFPLLKFKFDKTSSILVSPLIGFTTTFTEGQLEKEDYYLNGLKSLLCLNLVYEQGLTDNVSLNLSFLVVPISTGTDYKLKINNTYYWIKTSDVYGISSLSIRYRF